MSKTTFSNRCTVLGTLWAFYKDTDNETWRGFFEWADLGLPLAYMVWMDFAKPTNNGRESIEEVWEVFCNMIDIDPNGEYESLNDAFNASDHPVLD